MSRIYEVVEYQHGTVTRTPDSKQFVISDPAAMMVDLPDKVFTKCAFTKPVMVTSYIHGGTTIQDYSKLTALYPQHLTLSANRIDRVNRDAFYNESYDETFDMKAGKHVRASYAVVLKDGAQNGDDIKFTWKYPFIKTEGTMDRWKSFVPELPSVVFYNQRVNLPDILAQNASNMQRHDKNMKDLGIVCSDSSIVLSPGDMVDIALGSLGEMTVKTPLKPTDNRQRETRQRQREGH